MKSNQIPKPVVLIILDGWGIAPKSEGNAVELASKPNFNKYWHTYPHTQLEASGQAVGLPKDEDGNSEVGHLNLGAGRIVYQELSRINMSIADGTFLTNPAFLEAIQHAKNNNSFLHLMGLVGSGLVHSSYEHLFALLWLCREQGLKNIFVHLFTDGRDSPPNEAVNLVAEIEKRIKEIGNAEIASLCGRYYAMDRDNRWGRTQKAYECLTSGIGEKAENVQEAILKAYEKGQTDEFILPTVIHKNNKPVALISDKDSVIFFNFREDRARQLTKAFILPDFVEIEIKFKVPSEKIPLHEREKKMVMRTFERKKWIENLFFVSMTEYEKGLPVSRVAFPADIIKMPLGRVLSENNKTQLHIAETEKYAHVTYFFNGGREDPFSGEERVLIPSPQVATYDLKPEMSAQTLVEVATKKIEQGIYDFVILNFANPDMVAHTGNKKATITAIEVVDACLENLISAIMKKGGEAIITADHGNAEELINVETMGKDTEHSNNPVPFIYVSQRHKGYKKLQTGILADIAPTTLGLMKIRKPLDMTGKNLLSGIKLK